MKKLVSILLTLALVVSFALAVPVAAVNNILNVPSDYLTIQAAVDAASPGDTILVAAGTYDEDVTIGTTDVTLQAVIKHEAIIEGTVVIIADRVTVDGFSIENFSKIPTPDWSGIYIPSGTDVTVVNNLIDGVVIDPVANLTVGIHTLYGANAEATLKNNVVRNVRLGIYNQGASLLITGNLIENTSHCAIGVDTDLVTTITGNTISNNKDLGIEVFGANVVANFNNIVGNPNFGVQSFGPQVDATGNWWGDASGPAHASNPSGTGDAVSDNVDYTPWLAGERTGSSAVVTADIPDITAISVSPTNIDYGTLVPGQISSEKIVTVTNIGTYPVDVDAEVSGDDLFCNNLQLVVGGSWATGPNWANVITGLTRGNSEGARTHLVVPSDYVPKGPEKALLVFTAIGV